MARLQTLIDQLPSGVGLTIHYVKDTAIVEATDKKDKVLFRYATNYEVGMQLQQEWMKA